MTNLWPGTGTSYRESSRTRERLLNLGFRNEALYRIGRALRSEQDQSFRVTLERNELRTALRV